MLLKLRALIKNKLMYVLKLNGIRFVVRNRPFESEYEAKRISAFAGILIMVIKETVSGKRLF